MNTLYYGDNLEVLRRKIRDETVDLCYIDPPFNSSRNYFQIYNNIGRDDVAQAQAFIDTWEWEQPAIDGYSEIITTSYYRYTVQTVELIKGLKKVLGEGPLLAYLVSMTQRVNEIQRVLKPTGSFYLHCDPTCSHYLKLILDSVFCPRGGDYLNEISWKRTSSHNNTRRWGPVHDIIFFYSKSEKFTWNRVIQILNEKYAKSFYRYTDDNGVYRLSDLTGSGIRKGESGKPWKNINPTEKSRHWAIPSDRALPSWFIPPKNYAQMSVQERLDVLNSQNLIYFPNKIEGVPSFKRYLSENSGAAIQDMIADIQPISAQAAERLGYPTQKPEALLERIIQASSNEGDTVLDAYCGCGTSVAVAQRLRRNWIGIDITYQSISIVLNRLTAHFGSETVAAIQLDGIPRDIESARALANKKDDRVRKEFEKWAILTYSKNHAIINETKGADKGVDGIAYFVTGNNETARVIFQVKSGHAERGDIAKLNSDRQREDAEIAIFITLEDAKKTMRDEARAAGTYRHELLNRDIPRIQIVMVRDMIENGQRIDLPTKDPLKTARAHSMHQQSHLDLEIDD